MSEAVTSYEPLVLGCAIVLLLLWVCCTGNALPTMANIISSCPSSTLCYLCGVDKRLILIEWISPTIR